MGDDRLLLNIVCGIFYGTTWHDGMAWHGFEFYIVYYLDRMMFPCNLRDLFG